MNYDYPKTCALYLITLWLMVFAIFVIILYAGDNAYMKTSNFANPNDTQYNQRYVAADVPVAAQQSLNDRLQAATAGVRGMSSSMSGYRDPPVFWEGANTDMSIVNGNVYNSREASQSSFGNPMKDCGIPGSNC